MQDKDIKKRSYIFALNIIKLVDVVSQKSLSFTIISKQLIRSATSIGANIIEAQAGSSKKDFTNFLNYALKSANETVFWLNILNDSNKLPEQNIESLIKEATELANILGSSIITLRGKK
ncbi:MAG: four helix bundle protein [bacterium]